MVSSRPEAAAVAPPTGASGTPAASGGPAPAERAIRAEDLAASPVTVLKDDGPGRPRVVRHDLPDGPVVVKSWEAGDGRLAAWWARRVMQREARNYKRLRGVPGVPRLLARLGPCAFVVDYIDGEPLRRQLAPERLRAGLDGLQRTLEGLHERRFAHLDLHQRRNILVTADGSTFVVDFAQGVDCTRNWFRSLLFPLLSGVDRMAIRKFRARYAPDTLDPAERDRIVARYGDRRRRPVLSALRRFFDRLFVRGG